MDTDIYAALHAPGWLAQLTTHIPNKREQMVRYGVYPPWRSYYSKKCRGLRKKNGKDDGTPAVINSDLSRKTFKKTGHADPENWSLPAVLWREVDPLVCPKCQGEMIIIAFIEQPHIIKKILNHLNMWEISNHGPPPVNTETITQIVYDDTYS